MTGFSEKTVQFMADLKANNNRDWFQAHKKGYEAAYKKPAAAFATEMEDELERRTGLPHGSKIFRINRDVRFSKDKTPYNAHLHMSFVPKADAETPPAWMFGLDTTRLVIGVGVFEYKGAALDRWRVRIDSEDGAGLAALLADLEGRGLRISEPDLKRVPAPYAQDHPRAGLLKRKGLAVWIDYDDCTPAYGDDTVACIGTEFMRLRPVFDWMLAG